MILFPISTCLVYIPRILRLLGPAVYFNAGNVIVEWLQCEVLSWRQFCFIVPVPSRCGGWSVPTVSKIVHELLEIMQQPCSAQPPLTWDWGQHPGFLATVMMSGFLSTFDCCRDFRQQIRGPGTCSHEEVALSTFSSQNQCFVLSLSVA